MGVTNHLLTGLKPHLQLTGDELCPSCCLLKAQIRKEYVDTPNLCTAPGPVVPWAPGTKKHGGGRNGGEANAEFFRFLVGETLQKVDM